MKDIKIIKRDGTIQDFNQNKIIDAVLAAFKEVDGDLTDYAYVKAGNIADYILDKCEEYYQQESEKGVSKVYLNVEEIQDFCEKGLMSTKRKDVAKAYILYRDKRSKEREKTSKFVEAINRRNNSSNVENSNANVDEKSFSGREKEASADIQKIVALDYTLSPEISKAHREMLLYQHDLEKTNIGEHNCFGIETKFITNQGVKSFADFKNLDKVIVRDAKGRWKQAIVKNYGKQQLFKITFKNGKSPEHIVRATRNHRWILEDGTYTTNLQIGNKILKPPKIYQDFNPDSYSPEELMMWCKGFGLGDGTIEYNKSKINSTNYKSNRTRIRLCGKKDLKWLSVFEKANCTIRAQEAKNGDRFVCVPNYHKEIPNFQNEKEILLFFNGLYAADGTYSSKSCTGKQMYGIQSSNKDVIDFIYKYADMLGLYISSERDLTGKTTNYGVRPYTINFSFNPDFSFNYKVINIEEDAIEEVWCLEVEDSHNFILQHGIPTGNCLNIDFEKLLREGFSTRNGDIRSPASFSSACQLIAVIIQCQSQVQFGGCGAVHVDRDLAPYVAKSFVKHIKEYYTDVEDFSTVEANQELDYLTNMYGEIKISNNKLKNNEPTVYNFAYKQLMREGKQATEALYHNLNTLESRAGSQVPFSSLNFGRDLSPEGKLVSEWLLNASINGIGKYHLTPIFPISIFQYKSGENAEPGTPGYNLKQLALTSLSKRIYPNFVNCDWSQAHEDPNDPDTMFSTMGK